MYHIPSDKRAVKSAFLLSEAMLVCLKEKDFDKVSVSDLNKHSYVSRSTFYRLFDNTLDVLSYMCDNMFGDAFRNLGATTFRSTEEMMTFFNRQIMSGDAVLDAIVKSGHMDILYNTHMKYADLFMPLFSSWQEEISQKEIECTLTILTSSLCAYIAWWAAAGKKESPEELTGIVMKSFRIITEK